MSAEIPTYEVPFAFVAIVVISIMHSRARGHIPGARHLRQISRFLNNAMSFELFSGRHPFLQSPLQDVDFSRERGVGPDQDFDLTDRMKNRGVVTAAKSPANFG
jgi:hypothetical protein